MNVVSELELFADGEEVEGLVESVGVGVEVPVESARGGGAIDDVGGSDGGDGEHLEELRVGELVDADGSHAGDLSGDGVRGIEVTDVESAGVCEWSVGFRESSGIRGDGGDVVGATDGDGDGVIGGCAL